jgi:hypothetical protein
VYPPTRKLSSPDRVIRALQLPQTLEAGGDGDVSTTRRSLCECIGTKIIPQLEQARGGGSPSSMLQRGHLAIVLGLDRLSSYRHFRTLSSKSRARRVSVKPKSGLVQFGWRRLPYGPVSVLIAEVPIRRLQLLVNTVEVRYESSNRQA